MRLKAQVTEDLPEDFAAAVKMMRGTPGRVIVFGIGKSVHVGRKISAMLAQAERRAVSCMPQTPATTISA